MGASDKLTANERKLTRMEGRNPQALWRTQGMPPPELLAFIGVHWRFPVDWPAKNKGPRSLKIPATLRKTKTPRGLTAPVASIA